MKVLVKGLIGRMAAASRRIRRLHPGGHGNAVAGKTGLPGQVPSDMLGHALDLVSEGALITDGSHDVVYVNAAFSTITGYGADEVLGRNCRLLQGPGSDPVTVAALRTTLARGETYKGEILNYRKDGTPFWSALTISPLRDGTGVITRFVSVQRDVTAQKTLHERLQLLSLLDPVTGLPNGAALDQHLSMPRPGTRGEGAHTAVGIIDLDNFRSVNETFGHEAGDVLLTEFAGRLRGRLRGPDFLARLDGDEFVMVIEDLDPDAAEEQLGRILERLHRSVESDFVLSPTKSVSVRMSLGLTFYRPGEEAGTAVLRRAKTVLYHLKAREAVRSQWWDLDRSPGVPTSGSAVPLATALGEDGPGAVLSPAAAAAAAHAYRERLFAGGLCMYFQPIADLRTGEVRFLEALARLSLEDGTVLAPAAFLPLLTDADMDRLFRTGLEQILHQLAAWDARGERFSVSLNLPPSVLLNPDCARWVAAALGRHNIAPHRLIVELLENRTEDVDAQTRTFNELLTLGVGMALDDLGAGHSSLRRLTALSFSTVKIDQNLVAQLRTSPVPTLTFLATMVLMGRDMGWRVVAEGLEDAGITEAAAILGIPFGQGYHLARPMPAGNVLAWIADTDLPSRGGPVRTFPGALACHWQFARFDSPHPGRLDTCPMTSFLSAEPSAGAAMKWHEQQHNGAADHLESSASLLQWLTSNTAAGQPAS